jgi:hypothetical protein
VKLMQFRFAPLMILVFGVFLITASCSKDPEEKPVESGPPETTKTARYDHPEEKPGFSPDSPIGHCMVFAGYDSSTMELFLSDPADNLESGHQIKATFKPHNIEFINGYCTTVIGGVPATFTGAVVIQHPRRKVNVPHQKWIQYGMPDLSQHAIQPDWQCYCAPTSAANVISYFSESYPKLNPKIAFSTDSYFTPERTWLNNRLIAGSRTPFPESKSLAARMSTSTTKGTSMENIRLGLRSYLDENAEEADDWKIQLVMENETSPNGKGLWSELISHCSAGDGVLLCVLWGIPVPPSSPSTGPKSSEQTNQQEEERGVAEDRSSKQANTQASAKQNADGNDIEGSEGVRVAIPEREPEDLDLRPSKEIIDEEAIIVDDFNLIERNDIWYQRGSSTPFTGKARRSYPSGSMLMEIPYVKGKKNGIQTIWEENGQIMRKVLWKNGEVSR